MYRRFCRWGPIVVAFGSGLLLAACIPSGFFILLFGVAFVAAGVCLLRK